MINQNEENAVTAKFVEDIAMQCLKLENNEDVDKEVEVALNLAKDYGL